MMNFTYFLTPQEVKENGILNANVDSEYIEPALREAQDVFLREIIGDALYNAIENRINGNTLTDKYQTLVEQHIKNYLGYKMLSLIVVGVSMKIRNAGVIQQFDQGFNSSNVKDVAYLADYYNNRVEFYENRMTAYLTKNSADFPEYGYSSENITNPSQTHTAGTIYLGGGRKRSCGLKTGSGGGSTDRVDWNDIQNKPDFATVATSGSYNDLQNKPDFATVATSGDYEDLQNKPNIPTVNNATLTIKQGGTTKGTFTANAGTDVEIDLDAGGSGSTDWNDITNKPDFATVATSGDYNDLTNKPTIPAPQVQADWQQNDSTQPDYIKNRPSMPSAQIQSDWNQTNTSEVDYIKNKPTIPVVPTNVSAFTNDAGYLTQHQSLAGYATETWVQQQGYSTFSGSYNDLSDKPTIPTKTSELTNDSGYSTFSGSYNDLRDIPNYFSYFGNNISNNGVKLSGQTQFGDNLDTDISAGVFCNFKVDKAQSTKLYTDYIITGENTAGASELIVEGDDGGNVYGKIASDGIYEGTDKLSDKYLQIANLPTNVSAFTNDAGYTTFDGDYNSLTNKPTIPTVPTNVSAFTNDAGYLTQHQSLDGYATEQWVSEQGYSTFDGDYNSLSNKPTIPAAQVQSDWNANSGMAQILNKPSLATVATSGDYDDLQNKPSLKAVATSGDYNDLTNKPTIPAAQVQSDWNANSGMGEILNKPSMTAETWTFTLSDNTTVTKTVWLQPTV